MGTLLNRRRYMENVVEEYLIFKDIDIWTVCCCNWGDYEEVVITDNGDNTVNITTTPVHMKNTTSKRGVTTTEYNVDNTGGTYTAGTTKVPIGIKKSQCLAVTGIKGGILKLANCRLYVLTRSYDKAKEIYGSRFYRTDYRKADSPVAQFDIDADNYFRQNLYYMYFGYVNGSSSYASYPNFGYDIDGDAVLDLFGQPSFPAINGIGYFNSFVGYHPTYFNKVRYSVISEDTETLPYDAQVEYLQSSGTLYIELPYKPNQDTSMEISAAVAVGNGTANSQFFEVRGGAWVREYALVNFGDSNNLLQARFGNKNGGTSIGTKMVEGTTYKIEYRKNDVYINDTFVVSLTNYTFQCEYYLTLFGLNNAGGITAAAGSPQIRYMKIYDGDTLAMDLIPVRKGQVGYMYDKISNQLFANAGEGDFVLGLDIVPIEYLECTGTLWINSNIQVSSNLSCLVTYITDALHNLFGNPIIGSSSSSSKNYHVTLYNNKYFYGTGTSERSSGSSNYNVKHTIKYNTLNGILNVDENITDSYASVTSNLGYIYFGYRAANGIYSINLKYYEIIIFDKNSNSTLYHLVPVRKGTTGYLYDKISGQLFGNAGTGDFVLGPDKT